MKGIVSDESLSDYPPPPPVETAYTYEGIQENLDLSQDLPPPPPEDDITPLLDNIKEENGELRYSLEQLQESIKYYEEKLTCIERTNKALSQRLEKEIELKEKSQETLIKTLDRKQEFASEMSDSVKDLEKKLQMQLESAVTSATKLNTDYSKPFDEISQKIENIKRGNIQIIYNEEGDWEEIDTK